jgi:cobalt/nickel transport system permease protein
VIPARWEPRSALAAILPACLIVACLQSLSAATIAFAISLLAAMVLRVKPGRLFARLGLIALSLLPFLIILPIQYQAGRGLFLNDAGATHALTIALRALTIGALAYALLGAAPVDRTFAAARSFGLPASLTHVLLLTHRYSTLLFDEVRRLRIAWRVRAFRMKTSLHTYRTLSTGVGAVLVRAGERGERVGAAMHARGFTGEFHAASSTAARTRDLLAAAAVLAAYAGLALWDRLA